MRIRKHLRLSSSQPYLTPCSTLEPPPKLHHQHFHPLLSEPNNSFLHQNDQILISNRKRDDDDEDEGEDEDEEEKVKRDPTIKNLLARKQQETAATDVEDNKSAETNKVFNTPSTWVMGRCEGAKACYGTSGSSFSLPHQGETENWCTGERSYPLKERSESFKRMHNENRTSVTSMCNKRFNIDEEEESGEKSINENNKKKMRSNNGEMIEGSRCSRVNGRGWRCSQQTLVGYSLCDHHLGKGRLSSMRNKIIASSLVSEEKDGQAALETKKKRKKIGVVKARSMSSLLGLTQSTTNVITT